VDVDIFDDRVMRACRRAALKVARVNKRYVEVADVQSEMYVWVAKHSLAVADWLEQGNYGLSKLNVALYRAGHRYCSKERARLTGSQLSDFYWYTPGVIEELLPEVWQVSNWVLAASGDQGRSHKDPAEGGNRLAMLIDVAWAVSTLDEGDKRVLRERYEQGMYLDAIAERLEMTEEGARKRVERILEKLIERLGGEPPFWGGGRRVKSNAQAQSETRTQNDD
jgi:DNA-directed RNA polymerase specialized sigma24 family protein